MRSLLADRPGSAVGLVDSTGTVAGSHGYDPYGQRTAATGRAAGDRGYSSRTVRRALRRRGIGVVIPTRSTERRRPRFDRAAYRERNRVERLFNRLKQCRRIASRYEKRAANYHAFLTIAAILLWI